MQLPATSFAFSSSRLHPPSSASSLRSDHALCATRRYYVAGGAQGEGDDGQRRVVAGRGDEDAAVHAVEVVDVVELAEGVAHRRRPDRVPMRSVPMTWRDADGESTGAMKPNCAPAASMDVEQLRACRSPRVELEAVVRVGDARHRQAEDVAHAAGRGRPGWSAAARPRPA